MLSKLLQPALLLIIATSTGTEARKNNKSVSYQDKIVNLKNLDKTVTHTISRKNASRSKTYSRVFTRKNAKINVAAKIVAPGNNNDGNCVYVYASAGKLGQPILEFCEDFNGRVEFLNSESDSLTVDSGEFVGRVSLRFRAEE